MKPLYDKFEWPEDGNQTYFMALLEPGTQQKILNFTSQPLECYSQVAVDEAVSNFSELLTSAGMSSLKLIKRSKKRKDTSSCKRKHKKVGFDGECHTLRKEVRSLGRALRRNPYNKEIRDKFLSTSKKYKKMLKQKERSVRGKMVDDLCSLQSKNPKQFWKIIDQLKTNTSNPVEDINSEDWIKHFQSLYNTTSDPSLDEDIQLREESTPKHEQLNKAFSISEIKKHIKKLKNNKAAGPDLIRNEMLKCASPILLPAICKLFNYVLDSGIFPDEWNITYQVPLYKAGDPTVCQNYRGIAISSCLGKVFTNSLQSRLLSFVEENNKLSENQAAFRPGKSTTDHIFTLKSIVNRYVRLLKKDLYCCFVDFSKAFDSVWREGMLYKLLGLNINGKCYNVIKNMYLKSSTGVKLPTGLTETFHTNSGIRQGDSLSPLLFCLFIDDMKNYFDATGDPCSLGNTTIHHLLYADDLILFSESKAGLQSSLNSLQAFCNKWKLKINYSKTKILVFTPSGRKRVCTFNVGDELLEVVQAYKYLGITITSNGGFKQGIQELAKKGRKAWYSLRRNLEISELNNPKIYLRLFDAMIAPILTYGSEVWSQQYSKAFKKRDFTQFDIFEFEKVYNQACKQILGVHKCTSNLGTRLELGRVPLTLSIMKNTLNYFVKLGKEKEGSLLNHALMSEKELYDQGLEGWYSTVFTIGENVSQTLPVCRDSTNTIMNNLFEKHDQQCMESMTHSRTEGQGNKLRTYRLFKRDMGCESYIVDVNLTWIKKRIIARFRLSDHKLKIETGRHCRPRVPPEQRTCSHCTNCVEDELHFIVRCPLYRDLRQKYIITSESMSDIDNFINILTSKDSIILNSMAMFLSEAFNLRTSLL